MFQASPIAMEQAVPISKTIPEHSLGPVPSRDLLTSKFPTPLGALSILPRELRDKIYSHFCNENYYFDGESVLHYQTVGR